MNQNEFSREQKNLLDEINEMLGEKEGVESSFGGDAVVSGAVLQEPQYEEGQAPMTETELDKVRGVDWKVFRQMKQDDGFKAKVLEDLERAKNAIRSDMIRKYGGEEMKDFDEVMKGYPVDAQLKFYKFANKRGGIRKDDLTYQLLTFTDFLAVLIRELPEGMYEAVNHLVNIIDATCVYYDQKTIESVNKQEEMLGEKLEELRAILSGFNPGQISSTPGSAAFTEEQMNNLLNKVAQVVGAYLNDNPDLFRKKAALKTEKSTFISIGVLCGGVGVALTGLALVLSQLSHLL